MVVALPHLVCSMLMALVVEVEVEAKGALPDLVCSTLMVVVVKLGAVVPHSD